MQPSPRHSHGSTAVLFLDGEEHGRTTCEEVPRVHRSQRLSEEERRGG